jgi:hypothetical protein
MPSRYQLFFTFRSFHFLDGSDLVGTWSQPFAGEVMTMPGILAMCDRIHISPFEALCCGKAERDGEVIEIHLPMDPDSTPIAQKSRRVPYHLLEPQEHRINEFIESDIIEKVPEQEAIGWCSPLVVQPKSRNRKDIRVSLDLRILNQSMARTRHVQSPITEDFVNEFKDCTVFSKIDLNHGYHQFALDEESRKIMTFSTPWGNYRYKRLAFGGKNSQDLFYAKIVKIISGIPHVLNNRDDIMVEGKDWEEHNRNLETLFERLTILLRGIFLQIFRGLLGCIRFLYFVCIVFPGIF